MGISVKDIANVAKLSGMILGTGITGGAAAVAAPILIGGGDWLLNRGDDDKDEHTWKVKTFPGWKKKCRELMDIPMADATRARVLQDLIDANWLDHYGKRPKRSFVAKLHADVVFSVKAEMAATIPEGD